MTAALSFRSISKSWSADTPGRCVPALKQISFDIPEGAFFGLLGPNGAGKTTLISILAGLVKADSGQALVLGHDVQSAYAVARRLLGIVPQELVFDPFFTVREMLQFQSGYFGIARNELWIDEILHELDLSDKANTNTRKLSGGMKRRALVAQALVHKPPVIVLDEPTAGVDVQLRQSLWQFVAQLNQRGHTVLLTTHYLEEAEALCSHVAMLKQGQLIALEPTTTMLQNAAGDILHFKTDQPLPATLLRQARVTGRMVQLRVEGPSEIEQALAQLRVAGVTIEHLEIRKAGLEDIFLARMHGGNAA